MARIGHHGRRAPGRQHRPGGSRGPSPGGRCWPPALLVLVGGRARRRAARARPAPHGLRPGRAHDALRRARRRARRAVRALGHGVVRRDRAGRLRRRRARGVLPAVPAAARGRGERDGAVDPRGRGDLDGARGDRPHGAAPPRRRSTTASRVARGDGARDGVLPDVVLPLGGLQRVAVPRAVGRRGLRGADRPLGVGGHPRRPRGGDAQRGGRAARRPARAPLVGRARRRREARPALARARPGRRRRVLPVPVGVGRRPAGAVRGAGGLVPLVRRPVRRRVGRPRRRLPGRAAAPVRVARAGVLHGRRAGTRSSSRATTSSCSRGSCSRSGRSRSACGGCRSRTSPTSSSRSRCRSPIPWSPSRSCRCRASCSCCSRSSSPSRRGRRRGGGAGRCCSR